MEKELKFLFLSIIQRNSLRPNSKRNVFRMKKIYTLTIFTVSDNFISLNKQFFNVYVLKTNNSVKSEKLLRRNKCYIPLLKIVQYAA